MKFRLAQNRPDNAFVKVSQRAFALCPHQSIYSDLPSQLKKG